MAKAILTGSTKGAPIAITATTLATAVTIHTVVADVTDSLVLWGSNISSSPVQVTISFTGGNKIMKIIAPNSTEKIISEVSCSDEIVVKAHADVASVVYITGEAETQEAAV